MFFLLIKACNNTPNVSAYKVGYVCLVSIVIIIKSSDSANTYIPLVSTVIAVSGVLWQSIFAKGSFTVGDQRDTTPLEFPKHKVAL